MTRRDIIQKVILGGATLIVLPGVFAGCSKDEDPLTPGGNTDSISIDLTNASYSALNTAGGYIIIQGKLIANMGSNVFVAVDSICTHQGGTLAYNYTTNLFQCPVHNSAFSAQGAVIQGPATVALKTYPVSRSGDILTISFK